MGAGIAQIAALAGHPVQLHDARFGAADAAKQVARGDLRQAGRAGRSSPRDAGRRRAGAHRHRRHARRRLRRRAGGRGRSSRTWPPSARCSRSSSRWSTPDAILASNTSSLSITALAQGMRAPGARRRHALLQPGAADAAGRGRVRASRPTRRWPRRSPRPPRPGARRRCTRRRRPGFIVNRCARPFYAEALRLLGRACRRRRRRWTPCCGRPAASGWARAS